MGITDMEDPGAHPSQMPPAQLVLVAVFGIEQDEGVGIGKGLLVGREIDAMASEVFPLLGPVPREPQAATVPFLC